jgi:hypothetical protein
MTIKQNGGVFGRNPTFNNVTIDGDLTVEGAVVHDGDLTVDNINLSGNTISTTNTNGDLLLDPNGTGKVGVNELSPDRTFSVTAAAVIPVRFESTGRDNQLEFANSVGTPKIGSFDDNFLILTGGSETVRVDSSGHLIVPAGITLGTATGSYVAANTIDDYEEGYVTSVTMTPSTSGTITMLAAYTTLSYTKVGRIVTITGNLVTSSSSSPVGTSVAIGTLPFTVAAGDQTAFAAGNAVTYYEGGGVYSSTPIRVTENATAITWLIDASTVSGVKELYINLSYVAA